MPSPFPGMDPYLEGSLWPGFHGDLATETKRQLAATLAPKYFPFSTRYIVYEELDDVQIAKEVIYPDVGVAKGGNGRTNGGVATLEPPAQMRCAIPAPTPHYRVEIRDLETRRLVAVIEFLSPTNKYGSGRKKYLRKRRRLLRSSVNLIEIDLLLRGERLPMTDPYPPGDYFLLVSRAEQRPVFGVWPVMLDKPLPTIPIPLADDDADATLDMQVVFNNVYDLGSYQRGIDYRQPLSLELSAAQAAIVEEVLRKAGFKS